MWISKVELQNVKSYGDLEIVTFTQGVNAICGPNGAGKSTILQAIGFALFDALIYRNQSQFRREGCKQGHVAVTFIDVLDEREYQVVRPLGGGPPYINDPLTKKRVASGKIDVIDWLKDHLGVSPTTDLKTLFTDAVGIPQGMLATTFLETPGVRKSKFDPLLQVDEYEAVWEKLRDSIRYLENSRGIKEVEATRFRTRLGRLPELEEEQIDLTKQLAAVSSELQAASEELVFITAKKKKYDDLDYRIGELSGLLKQIGERTRGIDQRIDVAASELEEAKRALIVVESSRLGYSDFEEAQGRLSDLEMRRTERDGLVLKASEIERERALIEQRIDHNKRSLAAIQDSRLRIAELEPLAAEQVQAEIQLRAIEVQITRLEESRARFADERAVMERLQTNLVRVQEELDVRMQLTLRISDMEAIHQNCLEEIGQVDEKTSQIMADQDDYRQRSERASVQLAAHEHANQQLSEAEAELQELQIRRRDIDDQLELRTVLEDELGNSRSSLSENEQVLASLQATVAQITNSQEGLKEKIETLKRADEAECPVCQQPLTPEHVTDVTRGYEAELATLAQRMVVIADQRQDAHQIVTSSEGRIESIEHQLSRLPVPGRKAEIAEELAEKTGKVAKWRAETEQLANAPREVELINEQLDKYSDEIVQLKQRREKLENERKETEKQIRVFQERLASLATTERVKEIEDEIEKRELTITQVRETINELTDAPQRRDSLRTKLEDLDDPKQEIALLSARVEEQPRLLEALEEAEKKQILIIDAEKAIQVELDQFAGLDLALTEQNQTIESNRTHHERYLSNIQTAEKFSERKESVESLVQEKQIAQTEHVAANSDLEREQASYDPIKHEESVTQHASLIAQNAELNERHRGYDSQLVKVDVEIVALIEVKHQLDLTQSQIEELDGLLSAVSYLRNTIREAGPLITRRLVGVISEQANRMYGDIMADHSTGLSWELDYGITLEHKGEKRDFRQLSGGEQMAAALAVRLALLREMSGVRIAFFDEPTAHLDDARRENLAQQITKIRGFNQLFVISHDDTFERETHHVIRVSKENGSSHVEVA
ncbi:MAG: SMC family ATPase [Candidatus Promineifilaceae bacterium]